MTERIAVLCGSLLLCGCLTREVVVNIHTPAMCCSGDGCTEQECPLAGIVAIRTVLEQTDGTINTQTCEDAPPDLCTWEELTNFVFIPRVNQPSDAIEVRVEGSSDPNCLPGNLIVGCESFGDHVVDLERTNVIELWCDCPVTAR